MLRGSPKFCPEVQAPAVRRIFCAEHRDPSQWAPTESIAGKRGCMGETLQKWVRQGERVSAVRPGAPTVEQQHFKALGREA